MSSAGNFPMPSPNHIFFFFAFDFKKTYETNIGISNWPMTILCKKGKKYQDFNFVVISFCFKLISVAFIVPPFTAFVILTYTHVQLNVKLKKMNLIFSIKRNIVNHQALCATTYYIMSYQKRVYENVCMFCLLVIHFNLWIQSSDYMQCYPLLKQKRF